MIFPEGDLCRAYLTHLPGFSTAEIQTLLHLCASSLETLRALGGWREQLSTRTVQILTAAGERPLEVVYELSALLLLGLSMSKPGALGTSRCMTYSTELGSVRFLAPDVLLERQCPLAHSE